MTIASSTNCTPRSSLTARRSLVNLRTRRRQRIFLNRECMNPRLLVKNRRGHQVVCRTAVRVIAAFARNDDVADVLSLNVAAIAAANFCLQKELAEAVKLDHVSSLVVFSEFD